MAAEARSNAEEVTERIERLKRGEAVTGGFKSMTPAEIEAVVGKDTIRRGRLLRKLTDAELREAIDVALDGNDHRIETAARRILRRRHA